MVAYPDRGAGNDPFCFIFLFGGGGSLSPPRLNIFTVSNMGVMICLSQGGLHSLSASSFFSILVVKYALSASANFFASVKDGSTWICF